MTPVPNKHGLAAGAVAPGAEWAIDEGWDSDTSVVHAVWRTL